MDKHPRHSSRFLGTAAIAAWTLAIMGSFAALAFYARLVVPTDQMAAVITSALVDLTNKDRNKESLESLTVNPKLVSAAQAKADDMAQKGYFAHNSPEGLTSWHWFRQADYAFAHAGENLAVNFSDSIDVERAWMNSPTHRANILNGNFTEIGIATAVGEYKGKRTVFVVQMFGTPARSAAVAAPVRATVPEDPFEIAMATTEQEPAVLGTEAEGATQGAVAASISAPGAEGVSSGDATPGSALVTNPIPTKETLLTSPKSLLRNLYLLAGVTLLFIIALITRLEFRRHHTRHVALTAFLLVLMGGLFIAADRLLFPAPVIGQTTAQPGT